MTLKKKLLFLLAALIGGLITGKLVMLIAKAQGTEGNALFACFLISVMMGLILYLVTKRKKKEVKR